MSLSVRRHPPVAASEGFSDSTALAQWREGTGAYRAGEIVWTTASCNHHQRNSDGENDHFIDFQSHHDTNRPCVTHSTSLGCWPSCPSVS